MISQTDTTPQTHSGEQIEPWRWRVLALVCSAFFIVVLDFSVVNVALPSIRDNLKFSSQNLQWVASAYALTFGGFLLLGGRLADLVGRRTVLIWGVVLFSVASLLAGFSAMTGDYAQSLLIACRGAQGLGGALIAPAALSILNTTFAEGAARNRAMGIFGSVATAGFACGNLLGGILTGQLGWPSIFYVNVPIGIALVMLAPRLVPHRDGEAQTPGLDFKTLDISGAISVTMGLVALVYALVGAEQNGWSSPRTGGAFVISAVLLTAFVIIEKRAKAPLVPLSIFRRRTLTTANIVVALVDGVNVATILFLSLYLQGVKGFSPEATGFAFLPLAGWMIVAANLSPRVVTRFGPRPAMIGGTILITLSVLALSRLNQSSLYTRDIVPMLLILGTGIAGVITAGIIAATSGLSDEEQGLGSGLIQTSQQIGAALGLAILIAVSTARSEAAIEAGATSVAAQVVGLRAAFLVGAFLSALGCVVAMLGIAGKQKEPTAHEGEVPKRDELKSAVEAA